MRRGVAILAAAIVALAAAACSDSSSSPRAASSTTSKATTTTTKASLLKPGDRYVALGSSIAAGFGIPVQTKPCGRSTRNSANLIAQRYELKLTDVTCAAAQIKHIVDEPLGETPVQLDAVTPDTKLVTVSAGGNDIVLNGTALICGEPATVCQAPPELQSNLAKTRDALPRMIEMIKAKAPSATVVFVAYPREVPATENCPALSFTDEEAEVIRSMGEQLETMFLDVVKPADVVYVDPYAVPGDHTGCAAASQQWTAGHVAPNGYPYHPTVLGHQVMADMVIKALGN